MTQEIQDRYNQLVVEIEYHNNLYYNLSKPEISDREYDGLYLSLLELERQYPALKKDTSPTNQVGSTSINTLGKVTHPVKMESLQNVYTIEDLKAFLTQYDLTYPPPRGFLENSWSIEPKMDGSAISLVYKNGHLVSGAYR